MRKDRKRTVRNVASLANGPALNPNKLGMYMPLSPIELEDMLAAGSIPENVFSDRATGIAYRPFVPNMKLVKENPAKIESMRDLFTADGFPEYDFFGDTELKISGNMKPNEMGLYDWGDENRAPHIKLNKHQTANKVQETAAHEAEHNLLHQYAAKPRTPSDINEIGHDYKDSEYMRYRMHPEESIAFKAGDLNRANIATNGGVTPQDLARQINKADVLGSEAVLDPLDVYVGKNDHYSQYKYNKSGGVEFPKGMSPTVGIRNTKLSEAYNPVQGLDYENVPLPEEPLPEDIPFSKTAAKAVEDAPWRKFMKAVGKAGKVGGLAAAGLQARAMKESYDRAKAVGASPLAGLMTHLGLAPITERLKDGGIYNHATGEITYPKGLEPL